MLSARAQESVPLLQRCLTLSPEPDRVSTWNLIVMRDILFLQSLEAFVSMSVSGVPPTQADPAIGDEMIPFVLALNSTVARRVVFSSDIPSGGCSSFVFSTLVCVLCC